MDTETEKKLTKQQHQIDLLRTDMEANMKTLRAENEVTLTKQEAAIDRFRLSTVEAIGGLRATIFVQMISVAALVVAAVGVLIGYLQFFS